MLEKTFKALSDRVRVDILNLLKTHGTLNAGQIADEFKLTKATISYHLKILKDADLVYESRDGNFIYYELNASIFEEIMIWIKGFRGVED